MPVEPLWACPLTTCALCSRCWGVREEHHRQADEVSAVFQRQCSNSSFPSSPSGPALPPTTGPASLSQAQNLLRSSHLSSGPSGSGAVFPSLKQVPVAPGSRGNSQCPGDTNLPGPWLSGSSTRTATLRRNAGSTGRLSTATPSSPSWPLSKPWATCRSTLPTPPERYVPSAPPSPTSQKVSGWLVVVAHAYKSQHFGTPRRVDHLRSGPAWPTW